uniref:Uncharacterized protein n=1 Tax=Hucho hucho TaxID=62062 RepID=A0A4W5JKK3_9TELE
MHTLQTMLSPQPPLLNPLYIYESKMALLTRVAKTGQGAVEQLRCGLVTHVFNMVPDSDSHRGIHQCSSPALWTATDRSYYLH